jgi:hypothetical protein
MNLLDQCRFGWITLVGLVTVCCVQCRETHSSTYSPRGFEAAIHRYEQSSCRPIHFIQKEYQSGADWHQVGWAFLGGLLVGLLLISTWRSVRQLRMFKRTQPASVHEDLGQERRIVHRTVIPLAVENENSVTQSDCHTVSHPIENSETGEINRDERSETLVVLEEVERVARAMVDRSSTDTQSSLHYESLRHIGLGVVKIADDRKYQRERLKEALETKELYTKKLLNELQKAAEKEFQDLCLETLLAGIVVMALTLLWLANVGVIKESFIKTQHGRCGRLAMPSVVQGLNWVSFLFTVVCHLRSLINAASGLFLLFFAPYAMYRAGILTNFGRMTFLKLGFGLGLGCGAVGTITVNSIGGHGLLWALVWLVWVALHLILAGTTRKICMADARSKISAPLASYDTTDSREMSMIKINMWVYLVLIIPVLSAILPFYDELL